MTRSGHRTPIVTHGRAPSWASWRSSRAGRRWSTPMRSEPVEALIIPPDRLRALLVAEAELGERIMRALILRRVGLLETGAGGPVIVGRADERRRAAARRISCAATAIRISGSIPTPTRSAQGADRALPRRPPASCRSCSARAASCCAIRARSSSRAASGWSGRSIPNKLYDVAIVGAGPAGLATAVYAASEGLLGAGARLPRLRRPGRRLGADRELSRLSDRHHRHGADGARLQPGAEIRRRDGDPGRGRRRLQAAARRTPAASRLQLCGDERVSARAVVIASGARYRRLDVDNLDAFEGAQRALLGLAAGGASCAPARRWRWSAPAIRPARPSVYLASQVAKVWMLVRGRDLGASMSRYLVDRIAGLPNVEVVTRDARSRALEGKRRHAGGDPLAPAHRARRRAGRSATCSCSSAPSRTPTGWPARGVALDAKGFVRTGAGAPDCGRWRPAGAASSRSATSARARSSGSPRRSAKAPRWWRPCMPFWPVSTKPAIIANQ